MLVSCVPMLPGFEEPQVSLSRFRVLPSNSMVPTFEIGLHIINPNRTALKLSGLSYTVELEGARILSGVSSQLPRIEAYGEGDILLEVRPDLFNTINLFSQLIQQPRDSIDFKLEVLLDVGSLWPKIRVEKSDQISLKSWQNN
jgi:LEA14-like dessication related protein